MKKTISYMTVTILILSILSTIPMVSSDDTPPVISDNHFRVVAVSDPQLGLSGDAAADYAAWWETGVDEINAWNPDMVIVAGDLIDDGLEAQWDWYKAGRDNITAPVYDVMGNHDGQDGSQVYFDRFYNASGNTNHNYVVDVGNIRFIMWSTYKYIFTANATEQLWVEEQIQPGKINILVTHHSFSNTTYQSWWKDKGAWDPSLKNPVMPYDWADSLFQDNAIDLHMHGHIHLGAGTNWNTTVRNTIFCQKYGVTSVDVASMETENSDARRLVVFDFYEGTKSVRSFFVDETNDVINYVEEFQLSRTPDFGYSFDMTTWDERTFSWNDQYYDWNTSIDIPINTRQRWFGNNILYNGDFEINTNTSTVPDGWWKEINFVGDLTWAWRPDTTNLILNKTAADADYGDIKSHYFRISDQYDYVMSYDVWTNTSSFVGSPSLVRMYFYDENRVQLGINTIFGTPSYNNWSTQYVHCRKFNIPTGACWGLVMVRIQGSSICSIIYDNITVRSYRADNYEMLNNPSVVENTTLSITGRNATNLLENSSFEIGSDCITGYYDYKYYGTYTINETDAKFGNRSLLFSKTENAHTGASFGRKGIPIDYSEKYLGFGVWIKYVEGLELYFKLLLSLRNAGDAQIQIIEEVFIIQKSDQWEFYPIYGREMTDPAITQTRAYVSIYNFDGIGGDEDITVLMDGLCLYYGQDELQWMGNGTHDYVNVTAEVNGEDHVFNVSGEETINVSVDLNTNGNNSINFTDVNGSRNFNWSLTTTPRVDVLWENVAMRSTSDGIGFLGYNPSATLTNMSLSTSGTTSVRVNSWTPSESEITSFHAIGTDDTTFNITGLTPGDVYDVYRDGSEYTTVTVDGTGKITFQNTVWSGHNFTVSEHVPTAAEQIDALIPIIVAVMGLMIVLSILSNGILRPFTRLGRMSG